MKPSIYCVWTVALKFSVGASLLLTALPDSSVASETLSGERSVYVAFEGTTWKPRGRLLYDIHGSILRKLTAADFRVVRHKGEPHSLTLSVKYDEQRGEPYGVGDYGTVIKAEFLLMRNPSDTFGSLGISEVSDDSASTPPYIDVLQKYQANPYYFFLGEIMAQAIAQDVKLIDALPLVFEEIANGEVVLSDSDLSADRFVKAEHSMVPSSEFYRSAAITRGIAEFVRTNEQTVIPSLSKLLEYPDERVRSRAIEALGAFRVMELRPQIAKMARDDPAILVRQTAQRVAVDLSRPTSKVE